jgi:hypothetical protein
MDMGSSAGLMGHRIVGIFKIIKFMERGTTYEGMGNRIMESGTSTSCMDTAPSLDLMEGVMLGIIIWIKSMERELLLCVMEGSLLENEYMENIVREFLLRKMDKLLKRTLKNKGKVRKYLDSLLIICDFCK